MRNGSHAWATPRRPKFQNDYFAFQFVPTYFVGRGTLYRFGQNQRWWNVANFGSILVRNRKRTADENSKKTGRNQNQFEHFHNGLGSNLPVADAEPLVAGQFVQTHRAARADFVRADADLRAHAEFAAVGEARARVPINRRRIHFGQELLRVRLVLRHDAVRVRRAVKIDVVNRAAHAVHYAHIQNVVVIFGEIILLGSSFEFLVLKAWQNFQNRSAIQLFYLRASAKSAEETFPQFFYLRAKFPSRCKRRDVALSRSAQFPRPFSNQRRHPQKRGRRLCNV